MRHQRKTLKSFMKRSSGKFAANDRMGVKQRWKRTDKEYIDAQHASLLDKKEALYSSLRAAVVRRHYLLKLKAKYAGERVIYK